MTVRRQKALRHTCYALIVVFALLGTALAVDAFTIHHIYGTSGTIIHVSGTTSQKSEDYLCKSRSSKCIPTFGELMLAGDSETYALSPDQFSPEIPE